MDLTYFQQVFLKEHPLVMATSLNHTINNTVYGNSPTLSHDDRQVLWQAHQLAQDLQLIGKVHAPLEDYFSKFSPQETTLALTRLLYLYWENNEDPGDLTKNDVMHIKTTAQLAGIFAAYVFSLHEINDFEHPMDKL